jgi:hypothetical protein
MSALILLPAAGCVIAATAGVLICIDGKRADKQMREEFKNVLRLREQLNCRKSTDD